ncbi:MAG TPA: IS21 family transposase [Clostridia bacterium]|nr:IS21 family transposase [Clostridia bacterium]
MQKVREIIRLRFETDLSIRQIAATCGVGKSVVQDVLKRAHENQITWPITMTSQHLLATIYPPKKSKTGVVEPNVDWIHCEMKKKHVTLMLLWEEYKTAHPDGLMYTQFCERYRVFKKQNQLSMHKEHKAGEEMEVDWAGTTMTYSNRKTGEKNDAYVFIAVLPASRYPFVYAYNNMKLRNWINAHVRAFKYFGGVPKMIIPDNTKTATIKADTYNPILNRTYSEMARHYQSAIVPARAYRPKDKASGENHVKIAGQRIIAKLRNEQFFSLEELNLAIKKELKNLVNSPFKKMEGTRQSLFEKTDKLALKSLPAVHYEYAFWKEAKVQTNYHVEYERYYYSVHYSHVGSMVSLRVTDKIIEIYLDQKRIAVHEINNHPYERYKTLREHMPAKHQATSNWSEDSFLRWSESIGPNTEKYIKGVLSSKDFPEQSFKTCMGIMGFGKKYSCDFMEKACEEADSKRLYSYRYFSNIVKRLEKSENKPTDEKMQIVHHKNIRGIEGIVGGTQHAN